MIEISKKIRIKNIVIGPMFAGAYHLKKPENELMLQEFGDVLSFSRGRMTSKKECIRHTVERAKRHTKPLAGNQPPALSHLIPHRPE